MKKIKYIFIIMMSIFLLAACQLNNEQVPSIPENDEIVEGEESYTLTFKTWDTKESIISFTKKTSNAVFETDVNVVAPNGYALSFVDEFGNPVDVPRTRTTTTIYVKYSPKEYTLRFVENGQIVSDTKVAYNETIQAPEATKIPTGKKFVGWSTSKNEYVPYVFDKMPAESLELYAHYEDAEYTITLVTNVASLNSYNNVSTYKYNDRIGNFVPSELENAINNKTILISIMFALMKNVLLNLKKL